jgi:dGTPase
MLEGRTGRRHSPPDGSGRTLSSSDTRSVFEVDRDRVMYSDALRRLGGVTQVAGPYENHQFHNRYSHTNKVAQVAQRLTQRLLHDQPSLNLRLDPSVVETAALVHDLGHPPFGHIAEKELNRLLVEEQHVPEGYEGNAQSFRIVTKLSVHDQHYAGLDLTRAVLNAVLKYPWQRDLENPKSKRHHKFGVYASELDDFRFAREGFHGGNQDGLCLEAQIMDYADEVTYSIHDFEDFYRAGFIPVNTLRQGGDAFDRLMREWNKDLEKKTDPEGQKYVQDHRQDFLLELAYFPEEYIGTREDLIHLRELTSAQISKYVNLPKVVNDTLEFNDAYKWRLRFFQQLVWQYVIRNPRLATQQAGHRRIIQTLFDSYLIAIEKRSFDVIPRAFRELIEEAHRTTKQLTPDRRAVNARLAADIVASYNDQQAATVYRRLLGTASGAITDMLE